MPSDQNTFPRWLEAAKILSADPSQRIPCPVCQSGALQAREFSTQAKGGAYVELILSCEACGAWNSVLKNVPRGKG